jgi:phosphotransferase system HPr (HPr) family protein
MGRAAIVFETDMDLRSRSLFVQAAGMFESRIELRSGDKTVNAKSMMGVLALEMAKGQAAEIYAEGADAAGAVAALRDMLEAKDR